MPATKIIVSVTAPVRGGDPGSHQFTLELDDGTKFFSTVRGGCEWSEAIRSAEELRATLKSKGLMDIAIVRQDVLDLVARRQNLFAQVETIDADLRARGY